MHTSEQSGDNLADILSKYDTAMMIRVKDYAPEEPRLEPSVLAQLDMEAKSSINEAQISEVLAEPIYCVYSKPAWYTQDGHEFKIIDLVVFAKTQEQAHKRFLQQQTEAEERRTELLNLVGNDVLPRLLTVEKIQTIVGRGSVFDENRLPTGDDTDIDIIIFTQGSAVESDVVTTLAGTFKGATYQVGTSIYRVSRQGYGSDIEDKATIQPGGLIRVNLDLFPLEASLTLATLAQKGTGKMKQILTMGYADNVLRNGIVLLDRSNGVYEEFRSRLID